MNWLVFLSVLPALVVGQCLSPDDGVVNNDPDARQALYNGQQQFSLNLLEAVNKKTPTENIFFSPFSVYNAMMLAYFISANHTEQALKKVLALPDSQDKLSTMQSYRLEKYFQMMKSINESTYDLESANRLFVSPKQEVRKCMQELFTDEIAYTDFAANPSLAAKNINKWVEDVTKDQIKDLIKDGSLTENTQLVLANAAYFKGKWKSTFQASATKRELFYTSPSEKGFVSMMKQKATYPYFISEKLGAHVLELEYEGEDVSMYILLPPFQSPSGVANVLQRLNLKLFQEIIEEDSMIPRLVEVSIPKFSVEQELELVPALESIGVGDLFKSTADLSGLTGQPGLSLDEAIHKAKIVVNEEGTTAAAATAFFNFRSSRPLDPAKFICNHPFIYLLYDKVSKAVLFVGVFNKPPPSE